MVNMKAIYEGGLRCRLTHGPSGSQIVTDAPVDNMGKGEAFSPTDLLASALGSCILTVMGIAAQRSHVDMTGSTADIVKEMVVAPVRRIGKIDVTIRMAKRIPVDQRPLLEKAAQSCPVYKSLHPDVQANIQIIYPD